VSMSSAELPLLPDASAKSSKVSEIYALKKGAIWEILVAKVAQLGLICRTPISGDYFL